MSLCRCSDGFTTLYATFEMFTPISSVLATYPLNCSVVYKRLPLCLTGQSRSCSSTPPQQRHNPVSFVTFGFQLENLKKSGHLGNLGIDRRIILKRFKQFLRAVAGFFWFMGFIWFGSVNAANTLQNSYRRKISLTSQILCQLLKQASFA